jgi:hypothetical protein
MAEYRRHEPEETLLYKTVAAGLDDLRAALSLANPNSGGLPHLARPPAATKAQQLADRGSTNFTDGTAKTSPQNAEISRRKTLRAYREHDGRGDDGKTREIRHAGQGGAKSRLSDAPLRSRVTP